MARRLGATLTHGQLRTADEVCEQLVLFVQSQQHLQREQQLQQQGEAASALDAADEQQGRQQGAGSSGAASPLTGLPMPSKPELCKAGRADLANAISRLGGSHYFAQLLGLREHAPCAAAAEGAAATLAHAPGGMERPGAAAPTVQPALVAATPRSVSDLSVRSRGSRGSGTPAAIGCGGASSGRGPAEPGGCLSAEGAIAAVAPMNGRQRAHAAGNIGGHLRDYLCSSLQQGEEAGGAAAAAAMRRPAPAPAPAPTSPARVGACPPPPLLLRVGTQVIDFLQSKGLDNGTMPSRHLLADLGETGLLGLCGAAYDWVVGLGCTAGWNRRGWPPCCHQSIVANPAQPSVLLALGCARISKFAFKLTAKQGDAHRPPCFAGRRDLANAVVRCGGERRLAEHLGLEYRERRGRKRREDEDAGSVAASAAAAGDPGAPFDSALADDFILI